MICQACGIEAPTKKVFFVQHIGAVVMFFHKRIGGMFCRDCMRKYFNEYTLKTLFLGCWGVISVFATPVVLLINIVNRLRAGSLAPVPPGAKVPVLTDEAVNRLHPLTSELVDHLNKGKSLFEVAADMAPRAGVTPGQVVRYAQALVAQKT